tara:strand:+ start:693 stop:899 length:207 start_codon:yes stop_codon:yes gene_type:complete
MHIFNADKWSRHVSRAYLLTLIDVPDEELTSEGKDLKELIKRMEASPSYILTEDDKNIYDQRWRKIYK